VISSVARASRTVVVPSTSPLHCVPTLTVCVCVHVCVQGMCVGGNIMHLSPEILMDHERLRRGGAGGRGELDYARQEVWALGVLMHSLVTGSHPWPDYPNDCGGVSSIEYDVDALPPYPADYPPGEGVVPCMP
jgi:hypothetical protein